MKNCRILYLFYGLFLASCSPQTVEHDLLITNVNIIDVKTGEVLPNRSVAIDSNLISAIYQEEVKADDSMQVVDGTGRYLIPGLWDMHTHYHWNHQDANPLLIANGITGVWEMWGDMSVIRFIRNLKEKGKMIAPDIYSSGAIIDGDPPRWPGSVGVANSEKAEEEVVKQIEQGVDFIKVYSGLSPQSFQAIAALSNEKDIPFAGHIPNAVSIWDAMLLDMASAEHFTGLLIGSSSKEDSMLNIAGGKGIRMTTRMNTFSQEKFDSLSTALAESDLWLCPTLVVLKAFGHLNDSTFINDERLKYLPGYMTSFWNPKNDFRFQDADNEYYEVARKDFSFQQKLIKSLVDSGVKFIAGTDYPNPYCFPGFSLHDELALMVEGGMDELTALQTATINPALFMNKEDAFGTIEKGKLASLILLNQNPLEDIANTQSIKAVVLRGQLFNRQELDQWLNDVVTHLEKPSYADWLRERINFENLTKSTDSLATLLQIEMEDYRLSEGELNALGYEFMGNNQLEAAKAIFKKNVDLFPESYNVYDSYAEALLENKQYAESLENYRISLQINPYNEGAKTMVDSITVIAPLGNEEVPVRE